MMLWLALMAGAPATAADRPDLDLHPPRWAQATDDERTLPEFDEGVRERRMLLDFDRSSLGLYRVGVVLGAVGVAGTATGIVLNSGLPDDN